MKIFLNIILFELITSLSSFANEPPVDLSEAFQFRIESSVRNGRSDYADWTLSLSSVPALLKSVKKVEYFLDATLKKNHIAVESTQGDLSFSYHGSSWNNQILTVQALITLKDNQNYPPIRKVYTAVIGSPRIPVQ